MDLKLGSRHSAWYKTSLSCQARSSSVQNIVMAVSQKAAPIPVTHDSEEVRPSRNPVGLQVSKPDPPTRNLVRDANKPFQGLTSNSTPPQGDEDAEPLLHNEREHQEAIQQRVNEFEIKMHKFDENMKELKETMKKLEEELHVKEVKRDRRESKLKSKVAALEKRIAAGGGTVNLDIGESWETFESNLHDLVKKLRPGDMTIEVDYTESELIQQFKVVHDHVHTYETCTSKEEYKKKLQGLLGNFMMKLKSMELWNEKNGFQTDCIVSQVLFFLIANQGYRINGECNICLLCGIEKKYRRNNKDEGDPGSHIFPQSLLEVYREIHCEGAGNFIWNVALSDKFGAGKLTVKLLCQKCESSTSHAERKLRDLYVCILSHLNKRIEVPNEGEWLSLVFANIMFRGLVINVNLMNEIHNGQFGSIESLLTLKQYCMAPESVKPPPLYLSVLPSGPFRPELRDTTYIFDLQLRNPEFATVIDNSFLYTKFDCFHCTLPFGDHSLNFDNVLDSQTVPSISFQLQSPSAVDKSLDCFHYTLPFGDHSLDFDNVLNSKTIPSEEERKSLFPEVLLRRNLKEALQLAEYIISQSPNSKLDHHCKVFIEREPGICPQYSESMDWHIDGVQESYPEVTYSFKEYYDKEELKALVKEAAETSPLKAVVGKDKLQRKIAELQECRRNLKNLQSKFDKKKGELKTARERLHNCEEELNKVKAEKEVEERNRRAAELERDNLKEKHAQKEQEYCDLERRIEQLEKDNQELEHQLNLVTPTQVAEEAEDSMHNGLVRHESIPEPSTND